MPPLEQHSSRQPAQNRVSVPPYIPLHPPPFPSLTHYPSAPRSNTHLPSTSHTPHLPNHHGSTHPPSQPPPTACPIHSLAPVSPPFATPTVILPRVITPITSPPPNPLLPPASSLCHPSSGRSVVATVAPFKAKAPLQPHPQWPQLSQPRTPLPTATHTLSKSQPAQIQSPSVQRSCANCACTETPLWRRSPLGPKTVCNACGVRMKKGRLIFVDSTRSFVTLPANNHSRRPPTGSSPSKAGNSGVNLTAPSTKSSSSVHSGSSSGASSSGVSSRPVKSIGRKRYLPPTSNGGKTGIGISYLLAAIEYVETEPHTSDGFGSGNTRRS